MLAVDIASAFLKSQVLFAVVELGVPEALQGGPMTATALAAAAGCKDPEWMDRLLRAAAVLGIVGRSKARSPHVGAGGGGQAAVNQKGDSSGDGGVDSGGSSGGFWKDEGDEYVANSLTACLAAWHKSSMAAMVRLYGYNYDSAGALAESLRRGVPSHELRTGQGFWRHLAGDAGKGAVFDAAMASFKDLGGASVLTGYPWGRYGAIVDVAGGNGGFASLLLARHPKMTAVVVDQKEQVQRGREWWRSAHPDLLTRCTFASGDIFDGRSIPAPPAGSGPAAYVLRNILHNWSDPDALKILRAIRAAIPEAAAASTKVVIVELTSSACGMPPLLEPRLMADVQMLALFGGGKERSAAQFASLLAAAGFRLSGLTPTVGPLVVLEAAPV